MLRGLYTAYTGMLAQQQKMDTISNNLANVNTTGYKKEAVMFESFKDVYMIKINDPEQPGKDRIGKGTLGVKVGQVYTDYGQGSLLQTDNPLNMALDGSGMFAIGITNSEGVITEKYTRDGAFGLNAQGQITTLEGHLLLGENGPIAVTSPNVRISEEGYVYDNNTVVDKIKVVNFDNLQTLKKLGTNLYESTEGSQVSAFEGRVIQGYVEGSNVSSMDEMIHMINVMRTYEANQKIITTYDATLERAVNDVGRL